MTPSRKRRLIGISVILAGVAIAAAITLSALQKNMLFYIHPSQVVAEELPVNRQFRLGGFVVTDSVKRAGEDLIVRFDVTDCAHSVPVVFDGILPDLFREGEAIIAIGALNEAGEFNAHEVLAKHDEEYMPPEVADSIKTSGTLCAGGRG